MMNLYSAKIWNRALAIAQNCYICNAGIQTQFKMCESACKDFDLTGKGKRGFYILVFDMYMFL